MATAVERGHKDERDTRTPARSSVTRGHADQLIRAKQSIRQKGGLRTIEEMLTYTPGEVEVVAAERRARTTLPPLAVVERFSQLTGSQEEWLQNYINDCERAERAIAQRIVQEAEPTGAPVETDDESDATPSIALAQARSIVAAQVHGEVDEPATGRPRRVAALGLRAYIRAGIQENVL